MQEHEHRMDKWCEPREHPQFSRLIQWQCCVECGFAHFREVLDAGVISTEQEKEQVPIN